MESITLKKLRIHAIAMRVSEIAIENSKPILIGIDFGGISFGKTAFIEKKFNRILEMSDKIISSNIYLNDQQPSRFFGKPKNNYKK